MNVRELATASLRLLGVLQSGEQPTPAEMDDAKLALNNMLDAWANQGIDLEFLEFTTLDDVIPYPEDHMAAFRYNLAVELAPEYGVTVSDALAGRAQAYYRALRSQYVDPDILTIDSALQPINNVNRGGRII